MEWQQGVRKASLGLGNIRQSLGKRWRGSGLGEDKATALFSSPWIHRNHTSWTALKLVNVAYYACFFCAISCLGSWIPSNCTAGLALEISHFDPHNQTGWTARQIHGFPHKNLQHVPQWCEGTTGILWVSHQLTER